MIRRFSLGIASLLVLLPSDLRGAEDTFDSNGVKIHYLVEGKGEPVVLIHGFAVDIKTQWLLPGIVKNLAKDYQVIALDLRGHGQSDKPHDPKKYGLEMVEDVVRLLDHLKIAKAHVVGYSMGGLVTLGLIGTHPDRCLSATLGGMGIMHLDTDPLFEKLADALESGKGLTPLLISLTPEGKAKATEEQVKVMNSFIMSNNDPKALAAVVRSGKEKALLIPEEKYQGIRLPVLALVGDLDPLQKGVFELKKKMPKLQVVMIKGKNHFSAVFDPAFTFSLREFLAKHGQSG
jgi:pimeloyl-ACP methyl ester carboxylesterase